MEVVVVAEEVVLVVVEEVAPKPSKSQSKSSSSPKPSGTLSSVAAVDCTRRASGRISTVRRLTVTGGR